MNKEKELEILLTEAIDIITECGNKYDSYYFFWVTKAKEILFKIPAKPFAKYKIVDEVKDVQEKKN